MSCKGIGSEFSKIAETIDGANAALSEKIDALADGIANDLGITAAKAKFIKMRKEFNEAFKNEFGDLMSAIESLKEGIPFSDEIGDLMKLGAQTVEFVEKAKQLEEKYGKGNIAEDILRDPAGFIEGLGADFENLCEAMPNYEKAKDGTIKVTAAKFSQDAGEVDLEEIKKEGLSPLFDRIKDVLKKLTIELEEKETTVDKDTDSQFS